MSCFYDQEDLGLLTGSVSLNKSLSFSGLLGPPPPICKIRVWNKVDPL